MNKLVFSCFFIVTIGSVLCQNRVPPPPAGLPPYPPIGTGATWNLNDPSHPCNQPGANCNINSRFAEESSYIDHRGNRERYTRVCDDRGCYERRVSSGTTRLSMSFLLFGFVAVLTGIKNILH